MPPSHLPSASPEVAAMTDETVFIAALEKPPAERAAYLDAACGGDAALRERVERLLAAHDQATGILDHPAAPSDPAATVDPAVTPDRGPLPTERTGTVLAGRYKLLEEVGAGGMGSVWVAEQTRPVRRTVAVKFVKAGMDSKAVVARFEAERQALAVMDHPHIAKVLDGGTTEHGRPFFVMEYVKGVPLTDYCDAARLSVADRLALFVPVCQAVQHAHQKGIVHRDLKPSNVLVCLYDGRPVPKVIDFGLAKALHQPLTDHTLHTAHGQMLGTPLYMAPEQAEFNNLDVDTRSDVYALGVILYELLTGTTPLERDQLRRAAWDEVLRLIREVEPPRPSARLSGSGSLPGVAAQRRLEPVRLTRLVRGELDWIVMKCLEKDRGRRYDTANGLARDVERYLTDEPVEACPPSAVYRVRKLVRKYRTPLAAAAAVTLLLVGGVAVSTWQAVRATRAEARADADRQAAVAAERDATGQRDQAVAEKKRADEERAVAQAVSDFLQNDLLGQTDLANQPGGAVASRNPNLTVRTALDRAAAAVGTKFAGQPRTEAAVRLTIADAYFALGLYADARRHAERSAELRTAYLGADHADTLSSRDGLARTLLESGFTDQAVAIHQDVLARRKAALGPDHPDTLTSMHGLAYSYTYLGKYAQARSLWEEVLRKRTARVGPTDPDTLSTRQHLAWTSLFLGDPKRAEAEFLEIAALCRTAHGPDHPQLLYARRRLALVYLMGGKHAEAEAIYREVLEKHTALQGPTHPDTLHSKMDLAQALLAGRQSDRAEAMLEELLETTQAPNSDHRRALQVVWQLASRYMETGRPEKAVPLYEHLYAKQLEKAGPNGGEIRDPLFRLAGAYIAAGRPEKGLPLCAKYVEIQRKYMGADTVGYANVLATLGRDLLAHRQYAAAETYLRESLVVHRAKQPDHWWRFSAESLLGGALSGQRKYADAEPLLLAGYEGMKAREESIPGQGMFRNSVPEALDRLIELYTATDKPDEVKKHRDLRAAYRETLPPPRTGHAEKGGLP